jgi:hypothetical protein
VGDVLEVNDGMLQVGDKVTARSEAGVEATVCSEVGDEAVACSEAGIKDGRRRSSSV